MPRGANTQPMTLKYRTTLFNQATRLDAIFKKMKGWIITNESPKEVEATRTALSNGLSWLSTALTNLDALNAQGYRPSSARGHVPVDYSPGKVANFKLKKAEKENAEVAAAFADIPGPFEVVRTRPGGLVEVKDATGAHWILPANRLAVAA